MRFEPFQAAQVSSGPHLFNYFSRNHYSYYSLNYDSEWSIQYQQSTAGGKKIRLRQSSSSLAACPSLARTASTLKLCTTPSQHAKNTMADKRINHEAMMVLEQPFIKASSCLRRCRRISPLGSVRAMAQGLSKYPQILGKGVGAADGIDA